MTAANANRFSTHTTVSTGSGSKDNATAASVDKKRDLWNSMLDSVASGRRLPERNVLVFGGSVDAQREFLESLARNDPRRNLFDRWSSKLPPVANSFALGYTYYDVLDADQEDTLARINLYMLGTPSPAFGALLRPLLTPATIPNTLIVVLLDWAQPWRWLRQLRRWILLLRTVLLSLSPESKEVMESVMASWRERGRGGAVNLDGTAAAVDGDALPPGPGEWEDALGLPLCVVCQNSAKTDILEKTQGWKDDEFDLVLQYLRTVLVKHGASLIYTTPNVPSQLPTLLHACLGVTSLLKRQPLKPEVIKRTEVVVPSNWDSWTKILVVREGFDVERVSVGWSMDLQKPFPSFIELQKVQEQRLHHLQANGRRRNDARQHNGDVVAPADATAADGYGWLSRRGAEEQIGEGGDNAEEDVDNRDADGSYGGHDGSHDAYDDGGNADDGEDDPNSAVAQYERAIRNPGQDVVALAGAMGGDGLTASGMLLDDEGDDEDEEADSDDASDGDGDHSIRGGRRRTPLQKQQHQRLPRRRRRRRLEVETEDVQLFLGEQLKVMEQLRIKEEAKREKDAKEARRRGDGGSSSTGGVGMGGAGGSEDASLLISSHIGPVQFNLGGIQVDADDMLERMKNRHYDEVQARGAAGSGGKTGGDSGLHEHGLTAPASAGVGVGSKSLDTETISAFFTGLMNQPSHSGKT